MMLGQNVHKALEVFHSFSWFSEVGKTLKIEPDYLKEIEICTSWDEAVSESASKMWVNLKNDMIGDLSSFLDANYRNEYQNWNLVQNALSPLTDDLLNSKILIGIPEEYRLSLRNFVRADIKRTLVEAHWSRLKEPAFFSSISYIYIKGHFPCGWRGDFPNGKLLVF